MKSNTLAVIGAGNLAASVVPAMKRSGVEITRIYSRTYEHAATLAERVDAHAVRSIQELGNADFYLLAVTDNCIEEIASRLGKIAGKDSVIVHTSGSTDIDVLKPHCTHYGVFYPFQTFSAAKPVMDFSSVPVYIEANSEPVLLKLRELAEQISGKVSILDSEKRMGLHIAGAFSCNFVNSLLSCAFDICHEFGIAPCDLKPLVEKTVEKVFSSGNPKEVQTGPAVRGDTVTVEKHLKFLQTNLELKRVYALMSEYIRNTKNINTNDSKS
ncbi:MAG: DUF2520 domain-containing protein [Prevotellaceae bacterium]|jgi:predicted short-subunit dehydrogenase-like oxidoreductase (DUF2520 family)|nr:DUF2520 domain-containing protein [Prevotellaceae bacterium]